MAQPSAQSLLDRKLGRAPIIDHKLTDLTDAEFDAVHSRILHRSGRPTSSSNAQGIELGGRTLVLTASNDTFAGTINYLDGNNANMGEAPSVALP